MYKGNRLTEPQEYIGLKTKYILLITALGEKRKTFKIIWKVQKMSYSVHSCEKKTLELRR